jgi:hypothetical protein
VRPETIRSVEKVLGLDRFEPEKYLILQLLGRGVRVVSGVQLRARTKGQFSAELGYRASVLVAELPLE